MSYATGISMEASHPTASLTSHPYRDKASMHYWSTRSMIHVRLMVPGLSMQRQWYHSAGSGNQQYGCHGNGLAEDCGNYNALEMEMPYPCAKPLMCRLTGNYTELPAVQDHWNYNALEMGVAGLILGLRPVNKRRRYFVTPSLIGWVQT